jgi:hypothetical protein
VAAAAAAAATATRLVAVIRAALVARETLPKTAVGRQVVSKLTPCRAKQSKMVS